jgi:hemin uptake protein HemP
MNTGPSQPASPAAPQPTGATAAKLPRVDSAQLLGGHRILEIVHLGEVYRLQSTRFGKLILTK